jgi:hypothetical protein
MEGEHEVLLGPLDLVGRADAASSPELGVGADQRLIDLVLEVGGVAGAGSAREQLEKLRAGLVGLLYER